MAYRNTSSTTSSTGANSGGFSLPSMGGRPGAIGAGVGAIGSTQGNLLSAFNSSSSLSGRQNVPGLTGVVSPPGAGAGLGSNANQAQAAFLNAGPNRTVSNVGAQAAQGGMGTASALGQYGSPGSAHPTGAPGLSDLNLDPSDFPALGTGNAGSGNPSSAPGGPLASSYATQASQGSVGQPNQQPFFGNTNATTSLTSQQREFSADDFPALGTPTDQTSQYPGGQVNGFPASQARASQEQASAVAALAHRQNLLGSMSAGAQNQARSVTNAAASTVFQDDASFSKRNYANKLSQQSGTSLSPHAANSPLPPHPSSQSSNAQLSPHQGHTMLNGISQMLEQSSSSPNSMQQTIGGSRPTNGIPPMLSNLLAQQQLTNQRQPQGSASRQLPQTPAQQVLFSPADKFGLAGLLHILQRASDPDFATLSLGMNLGKLGLDMGAPENLHTNFVTPWADQDQVAAMNIEPEYQLPSCYNVQPPPASSKVASFSDETLFFIFYSQPRDAMQEAAAEQLYKRNWRYHKDLHLWLTKDAGNEPTQKTATYERGSYVFFDPNAWEKVQKEFVLMFDHLETRHRNAGGMV